ncbi:YHS domain-containing (seleno)protein [Jannaschia aquimarina]|uniref:YHS domain protein n=1 Tax=Jannaschia aquimarina TaxID=935700 RepID=A0A0D1EIF0_9RHOB|nr:YHS domain-containing (seleno)protein [Jannaschia aquimarina]KIT15625.1 YHS domain protein [Jannaschia aquimarina]SNT02839.1 YHS domain-containing protein [Jannaschia aquimarina]
MPTRRNLLIGAGAVTVAAAAGAYALIPRTLPPARVFAEDGVAIRGTDPVAYFNDGAPMTGSAEYSHDWAGATWHFASAENRDAFAADPLAYAPQYGGFCAWAVAAKSELFSTQPENWAIVDGKLYLNFNDSVQETWDTDRAGFIEAADEAWPVITADL